MSELLAPDGRPRFWWILKARSDAGIPGDISLSVIALVKYRPGHAAGVVATIIVSVILSTLVSSWFVAAVMFELFALYAWLSVMANVAWLGDLCPAKRLASGHLAVWSDLSFSGTLPIVKVIRYRGRVPHGNRTAAVCWYDPGVEEVGGWRDLWPFPVVALDRRVDAEVRAVDRIPETQWSELDHALATLGTDLEPGLYALGGAWPDGLAWKRIAPSQVDEREHGATSP